MQLVLEKVYRVQLYAFCHCQNLQQVQQSFFIFYIRERELTQTL